MSSRSSVIAILGKRGYGKSLWFKLAIDNFPRRYIFDPTETTESEYLSDDQLIERHDNQAFIPAVRSFNVGSSKADSVELLASIAYDNGYAVLGIEEFSLLHSRGQSATGWLQRTVFLGRHRALNLIVTAQRASSIPVELRSQLTRVISFSQSEKSDLDWLSGIFSDEEVRWISRQQPLNCLDWSGDRSIQYSIADRVHKRYGITIEPKDDMLDF